LGKSRGLIERWSARWDWVERAAAWGDHQEMRRLERRIEQKQQMDEEHLRIIRGLRNKAIQALAQMEPEELAKNLYELRNWIDLATRFERLIMGEPESIEERREKIEIHASVEERLKDYIPVFQELLDERATPKTRNCLNSHSTPSSWAMVPKKCASSTLSCGRTPGMQRAEHR
jgi:hypothetical protein